MRIANIIPVGSVKNADIFGSSKLKEGERVIDIAIDVENLPAFGKIVIKESNVIRMAKKLGYGVRKPNEELAMHEELEELRGIAEAYTSLRETLSNV